MSARYLPGARNGENADVTCACAHRFVKRAIDESLHAHPADLELILADGWSHPGHDSPAPGARIDSTVFSSTPTARPRQPACGASHGLAGCLSHNSTGRQSAVMIAQTLPGAGHQAGIRYRHLLAGSPLAGIDHAVPCTCDSQAGSPAVGRQDGAVALHAFRRIADVGAEIQAAATHAVVIRRGLTPPRRVVAQRAHVGGRVGPVRESAIAA
jgi:hypothetical protein